MPPADQRLHAGRPVVGQVDHGLVVQLQLATVEAAAQLAEQGQPGRRVAVQIGYVPLDPAAPLLRQVHGHIRALNQHLVGGSVVGEHGDPDADLDDEGHAFQPDRLGDCRPQPRRHLAGRRGLLDRRQQDGELVAAESGDQVAGPNAMGQPVGDQPQQPVPDRVPERVVDLLQAAVQVEQQEPDLGARARAWASVLVQPEHQHLAVGEPGQLVVMRLMLALDGRWPR